MRHVHIITPGDHFSPSTGSAVPTVVHGLCQGTPSGEPRPAVSVAQGTYPDHYPTADVLEYEEARPLPLGVGRYARALDAATGLFGFSRWATARLWAPSVANQTGWQPSLVFGHNAPQLIQFVDDRHHRPVLYAHNHVLRSYSPWEAARRLGKLAAIVCVSDSLAGQLLPHLPRRIKPLVKVVRNGVDTKFFGSRPPSPRGDRLRVGFIGRMIRDKGPDVLVEAVRLLGRDDIELTMLGSHGFARGGALTHYERQVHAAAAQVGRRAQLLPFAPRTEVVDFLHSLDVVVIPSRWPDPCPLTVLEGMAAGAAVVGSRIGGIPEMAGPDAILVDPGDASSLASALEHLADDEPERFRLAQAGRRRAEARDWSVVAAELHQAMEGL